MELSPARRDKVLQAIKRYSSMVYRLAYARTRSHADAEDTEPSMIGFNPADQ